MAFAVAIIWPCRVSAQEYAAAGHDVEVPRASCPDCRQLLIFWAGYERFCRMAGVTLRIWIRRGRCSPCRRTHALLPNFILQRRLDLASTIGTALTQSVAGVGQRTIAAELGVPHTTTRGWRRRHRVRAPLLAAGFAAMVVAFGGVAVALRGSSEQVALEALAAAWWHAQRRFGSGVGETWQFVAAVTGGNWLSTNTTALWAGLAASDFIPPEPRPP